MRDGRHTIARYGVGSCGIAEAKDEDVALARLERQRCDEERADDRDGASHEQRAPQRLPHLLIAQHYLPRTTEAYLRLPHRHTILQDEHILRYAAEMGIGRGAQHTPPQRETSGNNYQGPQQGESQRVHTLIVRQRPLESIGLLIRDEKLRVKTIEIVIYEAQVALVIATNSSWSELEYEAHTILKGRDVQDIVIKRNAVCRHLHDIGAYSVAVIVNEVEVGIRVRVVLSVRTEIKVQRLLRCNRFGFDP